MRYRLAYRPARSGEAVVAGHAGMYQGPVYNGFENRPRVLERSPLTLQGWAEIGIAMGVAMAHGVTPSAVTYIPQTVLTKSNVDKYFGSSNTTPKLLSPLPAGDDYLLKYGVLQKFDNSEGLTS